MQGVFTRSVDDLDLREGTQLRRMLDEIVGHSGASGVPLHGRLLAQWLHYAFPHECPYPVDSGVVAPKVASEWAQEELDKGHGDVRRKAHGDLVDVAPDVNA